jgi:hypothetical protein
MYSNFSVLFFRKQRCKIKNDKIIAPQMITINLNISDGKGANNGISKKR